MEYRFACVKSDIYQDLWVTKPFEKDAMEILKSTMMRTPAIGLTLFNTEFIIVKESSEFPCEVSAFHYKKANKFNKTNKSNHPFLHEEYHKHLSLSEVSVDVDSVDWKKYDIVLTINACIPDRIIKANPSLLWCYWNGENKAEYINKPLGLYDVVLNQDVTDKQHSKSVGFPYTFVSEDILEKMFRSFQKQGIYMEINNCKERPVSAETPLFSKISAEVAQPIILHSQDILENLKRVCRAKYFLKIEGRERRGNSVLESISCGTLVLANKEMIMYRDLICEECHVVTVEDVIKKILHLESSPLLYSELVKKQRNILQTLYFQGPISNLVSKYKTKQLQLLSS